MAAAGPALVLFAFVLLPHGSTAASIPSQKESERLVRRESKDESLRKVELSPLGEVHAHNHVEHHENHHELIEKADLGAQFCDFDFPLGKPGTEDCLDNSSVILEESMCIEAANRSGAKADHVGFAIVQDEGGKHPKGCYKDVCSNASKSVCYFYNGKELKAPSNQTLVGTIVCSRDMYLKGKPNTNDACPAGYKIISNEGQCLSTSNCMGIARAPNFRVGVGNESKELDFPRACFVDDDGLLGGGKSKAYYNPGSKLTANGWGKAVKGTPICQVAETVKWQADGTQGVGNQTR